jgi:hypothetical protein
MSGACGSSQIPGALGQHPSGSLVSANIFFAEITTYHNRRQRARHQLLLQLQWWPLSEIPTAPQGGPPSTSSSSSVVAATENTNNTPQGPCHRRLLHLRWWLLPDFGQHPLGAPPSMSSSISMVAATGNTDSTLQGPRHRRLLHLRWWLLPKILTAPRGGPPLMSSSSSVVVATRNTDSTLRGPAINVFFSYNSGCCRTFQQHPQGPAIDVSLNLVPGANVSLATPTRGHCGKHYHYEQDKFCGKIFSGPYGAKNSGIIAS